MSKILIVTPCPTHPPLEGNARRIHNMAAALLRMGHETHILYLPHFLFSLPDLAAMRGQWGESLHVGAAPWGWLPGPFRKALLLRRERLLERVPWLPRTRKPAGGTAYDRLVPDDWARKAAELCREHRFEVVITEYILISSILRCLPDSVLKVVDTHDVFACRDEGLSALPKRSRWVTMTAEDEAIGLARADVVLAIQELEAAHFRGSTTTPVVVVGHLLDSIRDVGEPAGPPSVLVVSSQNPINVRGLVSFLENSWPLVRKRVPDARLRLVGRIAGALRGDWPGVERLGVIADIGSAYRQGHVVLNPVLEGTGLAIKSIEALACGKPLVTTASGARGLADGIGTAFLAGQTPFEVGEAVASVLSDPELRRRLAESALRYAVEWNRSQLKNLETVVRTRIPDRAA